MENASGDVLWRPRPEEAAATNFARYMEWLARERGLLFSDYDELYAWSIRDLPAFWSSLADFFGVQFHEKPQTVLTAEAMPGAHWFSGATLNYAAHIFRQENSGTALICETEPQPDGVSKVREISRAELKSQVAAVASFLRSLGVKQGDRVVGYLPNMAETVVAFLAAASLGAVWSVAPAELSSRGVLDRFGQVEPKILFAVRGYRYGGKLHDRSEPLAEIVAGLPTVQQVVLIAPDDSPNVALPASARDLPCTSWADILRDHGNATLVIEPVPFEHPLWILYSSGTTGIPKAIVHGHGGMLLEHLKALALHFDLRPGDRFFWYTTAGWMMWNMLVGGLLLPGVTVVLYNGSPKFPDFSALWRLVDRRRVTFFGTSAPYLLACMKEVVRPSELALQELRAIGSTGAPLTADGFRWVYREVKSDLLLASVSGGTDVCTAFVLCHPQLPVRAGELQCRGLGAAIESWDEEGHAVFGQSGELVLTRPFPAMPVFFWNDETGERLRAAYFEKFPGTWCHGDWIEIDPRDGHCVIHGRSDSTLNRGGVRMGSAEFYAVVEQLPFVAEALVIDLSALNRADLLVLFVVLRAGHVLDDALRDEIRSSLRREVSPRHVPDRIYAAPEIPRTLNGKKLEVPVKRILLGHDPARVAQRDTLANPAALGYFIDLAKQEFPAGT